MKIYKTSAKNLILSLCFVVIVACSGGSSCYDQGYDDGYDGAEENVPMFCGDGYGEGYWDGNYDADCDYWEQHDREKYKLNCS